MGRASLRILGQGGVVWAYRNQMSYVCQCVRSMFITDLLAFNRKNLSSKSTKIFVAILGYSTSFLTLQPILFVCLLKTDPIAHSGIKIVIIAFLMFKLEMHQHKVEIKEDIWRFQSGFIQPFITFVYYYRSFHENGINWHLS